MESLPECASRTGVDCKALVPIWSHWFVEDLMAFYINVPVVSSVGD